MFMVRNIVLFLFLFGISTAGYGAIATGVAIDQARQAVEELIETAFDRLDFTLLQSAVEARATINQAADSLEGVLGHTIDKLDIQQRRLVDDLQQFQRSASADAETALIELRDNKNQAISDIRLLLSNTPGAIIIVPGYVLEGADYIDFEIRGSALSRAKIEDFRLNSRDSTFSVRNQSDTLMTLRVPLGNSLSSRMVLAANKGAAEVMIEFKFIEGSWVFFTKKRKFSSTGYIIPKVIGKAKAYFSGIYSNKEFRDMIIPNCKPITVESSVTWSGRKRGKTVGGCTVKVPSNEWNIDVSSAKMKLNLGSECSRGKSSVTWGNRTQKELLIKYRILSHKGVDSGNCHSNINIKAKMWREIKKTVVRHLDNIQLRADKDIAFNRSTPALRKMNEPIFINHIEIESPLFSSGMKILKPGGNLGGLYFSYDKNSHFGYLQFEKLN